MAANEGAIFRGVVERVGERRRTNGAAARWTVHVEVERLRAVRANDVVAVHHAHESNRRDSVLPVERDLVEEDRKIAARREDAARAVVVKMVVCDARMSDAVEGNASGRVVRDRVEVDVHRRVGRRRGDAALAVRADVALLNRVLHAAHFARSMLAGNDADAVFRKSIHGHAMDRHAVDDEESRAASGMDLEAAPTLHFVAAQFDAQRCPRRPSAVDGRVARGDRRQRRQRLDDHVPREGDLARR